MARKKKHPEHVNHERWLISYADFITLLFAFFVVMFAVSQVDTKKVGRFTESFSQAVGLITTPSGRGLMPAEGDQAEQVSRPRGPEKSDEMKSLEVALLRGAGDKGGDMQGIKIIRRGNELVLRLDAAVLFDSGDDRLKEPAKRVLLGIADEIRSRPVKIRVEGHTDDRPISTIRFRSNWDLSTARATSVVHELAEGANIAPNRLAAVGYAEFQPIANNGSNEGRSQNRRVDFVLSMAANEVEAPVNAPAEGVKAPSEPSKEGANETKPSGDAGKEAAVHAPKEAPKDIARDASKEPAASPAKD